MYYTYLDNENITLTAEGEILYKLLRIMNLTINMFDTDIVIRLMSHGNLAYEYSQLRKTLLDVKNP